MNNASSSIFQKIASYIDYYYWNPQPGHSPRWVNILIFIISIFLWFGVWTPIKVKTTDILQLSLKSGDEVYIIERTSNIGKGKFDGYFTDWMRLSINNKYYWCICKESFCPHGGTLDDNSMEKIKSKGISEVIVINNNYCLVTEYTFDLSSENNIQRENLGKIRLPKEEILKRLKNFGPIQYYSWQKIIWTIFIIIYLMIVYSKNSKKWYP